VEELKEMAPKEVESEDEQYLLSELSRRVAENNKKEAAKMVKKGGKKASFLIGQSALLAISRKNRLSTEATRLPTKVLEVRKNNIYVLLSEFGKLKGLYQGSSIVTPLISLTNPFPDPLDLTAKPISLAQAVAKQAGRKAISAMQKEGRKAEQQRRAGATSDVGAEGDVERERVEADMAEAVVVQDECDEQFATKVEAAVRKRGANLIEAVGSSPMAAKRRRTRSLK
jgi:hypothetical protein